MHITFTPMRRDNLLSLQRHGDILTINGEEFDFAGIPDGAILPRHAIISDWFASDIERISGVLHLTLILPHGAKAPPETLFPAPLSLAEDGPVQLPLYESPSEEEMQ